MKIKVKGDKVIRVLQANKGTWFDLSYRVRMNEDDKFDYENVIIVKSSNKSVIKKKRKRYTKAERKALKLDEYP